MKYLLNITIDCPACLRDGIEWIHKLSPEAEISFLDTESGYNLLVSTPVQFTQIKEAMDENIWTYWELVSQRELSNQEYFDLKEKFQTFREDLLS